MLTDPKHIADIVDQAKNQDQKAIKTLYDLHIKEMILLCHRLLSNQEDVKDILQESFVSAFTQLSRLKDASKFKSWLKRIVINNCLKDKRNKVMFCPLNEHRLATEEIERSWYKDVPPETLNNEISRLPAGCRKIMTLYLFEGYKHREIADMLKISESTSKSQYRRSLELLGERLKKLRNE